MALNDFTNRNNGNGNGNGNNNNPPNPFAAMLQNNQAFDTDDSVVDIMINYNEKFKTAGYCMFRDNVIEQTLACLIGKTKPNALLIGPAGCGKTKIVEDIAYRIVSGDILIPDKLKNSTIYELPLSNLVAGSSLRGQLEEKLNDIIAFCEDPKNDVILFIDEIHQLMSNNGVDDKIAQILKPALARGSLRVIGATTSQEATKLNHDPAFNRRFSRVIVDELTREQTFEILKQASSGFLLHYKKVTLSDDVLEKCTYVADQYHFAGNHRPDTALTLLDRAMADTVIDKMVKERQAQLDGDTVLLQALQSMTTVPLTDRQITKTAIKLATGHSKQEQFDEAKITNKLASIKGQDNVINKVLNVLKRSSLNLFPRTKPHSLMFIGPSGVGKTAITKIIADELYSQPPIILNMTEYSSPATINRIIGSPAGYVGSDSNAELPFDSLQTNAYQIILLDEFEKADKSVQRLFMGVLDEGTLTTNRGTTYDFSKSIVIATTNAAYQTIKNNIGFGHTEDDEADDKNTNITDLAKWFDPALLNRFEYKILFNEISIHTYQTILEDIYNRERTRILNEHSRIKLPDVIPDDDMKTLLKTYIPAFGARPAKETIHKYIEDMVMATP